MFGIQASLTVLLIPCLGPSWPLDGGPTLGRWAGMNGLFLELCFINLADIDGTRGKDKFDFISFKI